MKISIAMATYNGGLYLQEQLESFVAQTRLPDELVITDDGSTDNTLAIIEEFAKKAPFNVRYSVNEVPLGYSQNFDRALRATSGCFVFLSDQDDVWFPEKIERMVMLTSQSNHKVFMNDALLTDSCLRDVGLTKLGQIRSAGFPDSRFVMGCCMAVRRDFLDLVLPVPPDYPVYDTWIVKIAEGMGVKYIHEEVLQYYRRHGRNVSKNVVNSLKRTGGWHVVKKGIETLREQGGEGDAATHQALVRRSEVFLEGIMRAFSRCQGTGCERLLEYAKEVRTHLEVLTQRREMRRRNRLVRIPYVVVFWWKGKYGSFNGARSALRDIISPPARSDPS